MQSRIIRWAKHVARVGEKRGACRGFGRRPEGKENQLEELGINGFGRRPEGKENQLEELGINGRSVLK
jgi:hypothetical protein